MMGDVIEHNGYKWIVTDSSIIQVENPTCIIEPEKIREFLEDKFKEIEVEK